MTGIAASRMRGGPSPAALPHDTLTHVELTWVEKKIENWIRFGTHAHEQILDRRRRVLSFRPGTVFAFVRWASNDFGTIISRIDIVRAVARGEAYQTLPFVRPGGDILLKVDSWPKVERVLQNTVGGLQDAMRVQAGVVGNIDTNRAQMSALVGQSQGATGELQATQAGNQLLALQAQQLADLTAVFAANGRAQALQSAEQAAAVAQGREQRRRFLTPGSGYQPGNAQMFNNQN